MKWILIILGLIILYKILKFIFGHHHIVQYTDTGLPCYAIRPRELKDFEEPGFGDIEFSCNECGKRCVDHDKSLGEIECQVQMWKENNL